ncbi:MAG: NUDIX domain-containing protein [Actinomycetota bacterium]|nr:NUDIX domain-containing protein [Actinomycetota bacterium]
MWERLLVAAYARTPERPRRAVVRLLTPGHRVGVLAVLRRPDGRVLLVDQPYVEGWALPGGDLKRGETVAGALTRELREEIGLHVAVPEPALAAHRAHDRWVTFVAPLQVDDAGADALRPRSPELAAVGWYAPGALPPLHPDTVAPLRLAGVLPPG